MVFTPLQVMRQCAKLSAHAFIVGYAVDFGSKAAEQRVVLHDFKRNCTITVSCAQQFGKRTQRFIIRFAGTAKYAQALTAVAQLKQTKLPDDLRQERFSSPIASKSARRDSTAFFSRAETAGEHSASHNGAQSVR